MDEMNLGITKGSILAVWAFINVSAYFKRGVLDTARLLLVSYPTCSLMRVDLTPRPPLDIFACLSTSVAISTKEMALLLRVGK